MLFFCNNMNVSSLPKYFLKVQGRLTIKSHAVPNYQQHFASCLLFGTLIRNIVLNGMCIFTAIFHHALPEFLNISIF